MQKQMMKEDENTGSDKQWNYNGLDKIKYRTTNRGFLV